MTIEELKDKITPIFEESGVSYAGVFGSFARGENTSKSDIDILVSIEKPIGIYEFIGLQQKLEKILGRKVDLISKNNILSEFEHGIYQDLVSVYER